MLLRNRVNMSEAEVALWLCTRTSSPVEHDAQGISAIIPVNYFQVVQTKL